ncbi:thyroglobulin [Paramormyrops kingsleyae]|uniref:thyroglobulin n=1 Tax=Paramormyrops kingsleyae TaxID=1676925 RepID=UPI003B96AD4C
MAKGKLASFAAILLCYFSLSEGRTSGYQLGSDGASQCEQQRREGAAQSRDYVPQCSEDGRYRHLQCSKGGSQCWCVDGEGTEVPGSRQNGSSVYCLTSCQLLRQKALLSSDSRTAPMCSDLGEFLPIQCDRVLGQCWCVDPEGMEIYGTRQNGEPSRCPENCEVTDWHILHGVGEQSPPQCSADGNFLPVQCKFINTTDMKVADLLHAFSRFTAAFQTFSGFRRLFPEISSYCFCVDSRGRELANTGVELLLDEVYDTAFSTMESTRSFAQSNMYRILQRRFLGVQLLMSGRFRCLTKCESERSSSLRAGNVFVPACDANGTYKSTQCQAGGQCWCVDSEGNELVGTRRLRGPLDCRNAVKDCPSERRLALSRVFSGLSGPFSQQNKLPIKGPSASLPLSLCNPEVQELFAKSGLLLSVPDTERSDFGDVLAEVIQGLFPSGAKALKALSLTANPKRLQENLFGGKFLKNVGNFNFTAAVGSRGTFNFRQLFTQVGLMQASEDLLQLAKIFSPQMVVRTDSVILDQDIQDSFGRSINLRSNQNFMKLLGQMLESEQFLNILRDAIVLSQAEDSTEVGSIFRAAFQTSQSGSCERDSSTAYIPTCTDSGLYQEVQCQAQECWCVDSHGTEVPGSRSSGRRPRCPSQCERERETALRVRANQSAGSQLFVPKCESDGSFVVRQCSGGNCFCVDSSGGKRGAVTLNQSEHCPTDCQAAAAEQFVVAVRSVLWAPSAKPRLSDFHIPRCDVAGSWHPVQCDGPPESAFTFYREWVNVNGAGKDIPITELISTIRAYGENAVAMASFHGFLKELFAAGHHRVFAVLSRYAEFGDVPQEVLEGDPEMVSGPSIFLNPLSLWRLLQRNITAYPGQLSDFSEPLGHFELRRCWCVGENGDAIADTEATLNQIPKCLGPCSQVHRQLSRFLQEAEDVISVSNGSHVPLAYSFLLARGLSLTPEELQNDLPGGLISERLLSSADSALHLAAHSTLRFSWRTHFGPPALGREAFLLGYQPYSPQCDADGQWLPKQCYYSTGHCWCVDKDGSYIEGSLTGRTAQLPQCGTPCQRAQTRALLSGWIPSVSETSIKQLPSHVPSCQQDGGFAILQTGELDGDEAWCVSPVTSRAIQSASRSKSGDLQCPGWCEMLKRQVTRREAGIGYEPDCQEDGRLFTPVQCDQDDCWCVQPQSGQELPGTRVTRSTAKGPACHAPQCPLPFEDVLITHGALLCDEPLELKQLCHLQCSQGYFNTLPGFLCDIATKKWVSEAPPSQACQRPQGLQLVQADISLRLSLSPKQEACSSQSSGLRIALLQALRANGLCSLQMPSSGVWSSLSICNASSVSLECLDGGIVKLQITRWARMSDIPVEALPDLHDVDLAFSSWRLAEGVPDVIRSAAFRSVFLPDSVGLQAPAVSFSCLPGYLRVAGVAGCVPCPVGTFFAGQVCSSCPLGTYQDQEGRDFCSRCPVGTSTVSAGAFRAAHCVTECQRSGMSCTTKGQFQPVQRDAQTGSWICVTPSGGRMRWTAADDAPAEQECRMMEKFETVPRSQLILEAEEAVVLSSRMTDKGLQKGIRDCVAGCSEDEACHHLALYTDGDHQTHCDIYSTDSANVLCEAAVQANGFMGNPGADVHQSLRCLLRLKGGDKDNLVVLRKKGHEFTTRSTKTLEWLPFRQVGSGAYRTAVFRTAGASLTDVHRFCLEACSKDACCDGFILNRNVFNGGTIMCSLLSHPDVFMCSDADWDADGPADGREPCGSKVKYSKEFTFSLGGQNFTVTDAALPATGESKADYQASVTVFQRVYFWNESDLATRPKTPPACPSVAPPQLPQVPVSDGVEDVFSAVDSGAVRVDSSQDVPRLLYRIFKHQYSARQAEIWCLKRCEEVALCHLADVRDDRPLYFTCSLYPDTRVCGAYDQPLRRACSLVLPQAPRLAYSKKVAATGNMKNFYSRVPFRKMVSYSVRSRASLASKPIPEGFAECEQRCDRDPCCRGIGYIRDSAPSGVDALCLTLNSLGVQTCGEGGRSSWRVMDCSDSKADTGVFPFGWYEKPVNQWTRSPQLCPPFQLPAPLRNVNISEWRLLDMSSVLVDPSVSMYDVIHLSKDIAGERELSRDWCLSACLMDEACSLVAVDMRESALRCVLYPDTHACAPAGGSRGCRLVVKEPALHFYLRLGMQPSLESVFIPGHGHLLGGSQVTRLSSESKRVLHFLGVPYAHAPIAGLRFRAPQPADWTGSWNATYPRPSCLQPGLGDSARFSEDCLYLNIFVPVSIKANASVLVFFHNPATNVGSEGPPYLDGSFLAAVGDVIVVTASFRTAVFGFLTAGSTDALGNYGLQDQAAVLKWVQRNIAHFGGDPGSVTLGAEGSGADVASLHLVTAGSPGLFHRALLMGGSAFSPASPISQPRAGQQAASLAQELGCSHSDAAQMVSCLRRLSAQALNAAQTKLLAVSGPLRAWAPVLDGISVKESPSSALQNGRFLPVDLMVGSSADDGLIRRARNIKKFEELQGRTSSKTVFYQALSDSLGGGDANAFVKEAATWFYSMQHDPSPAGYNVFSRALENATRDLFIICPAVKMASFWAAHTRSNIFMYHLPEKADQTSADLSLPLDIQFLFGLPHHPQTKEIFTAEERQLSLQTMNYVANFIKSGNPNIPHSISRVSFGDVLPPWPKFMPHANGNNYKELYAPLRTRTGLRRKECSFWHDYVPALTTSTEKLLRGVPEEASASTAKPSFNSFQTSAGPRKPKSEKDAYS